jgi:hypothetical protein
MIGTALIDAGSWLTDGAGHLNKKEHTNWYPILF